jgi:predicted ester cyclase
MGSPDQSRALVRRFIEELCNGRNLDLADEIIAPDHRNHDPSSRVPNGPRGVKEDIGTYHRAFSDARWNLEELYTTADGNYVTARWHGTGTHSGELMGIQPTRKRVDVSALSLFRIQNNRIAESWHNWDALGMLQQLGAVPAGMSHR